MNNNNMDISKLMNTLSKMDKKDLENGIKQLNQVLSSGDNKKIIEQLKNNMNKWLEVIWYMDGDMNDIFQKLNNILEDKDMSNNLKNILNNFSSSNESNDSSESSNTTKDSNNSNSFNNSNNTDTSQKIPEFDINTILEF